MTLEEMLLPIAAMGEDFALFYESGQWTADWKNPSHWVRLGETNGVIKSRTAHDTPVAAVADVWRQIQALPAAQCPRGTRRPRS